MPIRQEETPSPPVRAFRIFCGPGIPERNLADSIELVDGLDSMIIVIQSLLKLWCRLLENNKIEQ